MKIYTATSWKNEVFIKPLAVALRRWGHNVYCFAELGDGQHVFKWPDVVGPEDDGITALESWHSRKAFDIDFKHLNDCDAVILYNPCGRDAHLEAGYAKGRGKLLFILGSWPKGEYSNMYHMADGFFRLDDLGSLEERLRGEEKSLRCPTAPTVQTVMQDVTVHYFAQEILSAAIRRDPIDALHDIELALAAWRNEVEEYLKEFPGERGAL